MVLSNFRKTFLLFWHKIRCIVLNKKEIFFVKKMLIIQQSPYIEIVWLAFFDGEVILKLPQKTQKKFFLSSNFVQQAFFQSIT